MKQPKAWLPFGPELLLERMVRIVGEVVQPVVVVAARGQKLPRLGANVTIVRDRRTDCGPMEGVAAGLAALSITCDAAFVASCDLPLLRAELVRFVCGSLREHDDAIVPRIGGFPQPLAAIFRTKLAPQLDARIARGEMSLRDFFMTISTHWLDEQSLRAVDPELQSLLNVNTPAEYATALKTLKFGNDV